VAYHHGKNLRARYEMASASLQAGLAMVNSGVVIGHLAAYSFSTMYNLPHGLSCAISLPYAMEYNLPVCPKLASVAEAMGVKSDGCTLRQLAFNGIRAVKDLIRSVGLPSSLKEAGVSRDMLPKLVEETISVYLRPGNPRKPTRQNVRELFEKTWEGRIG
jgi:alcohol dehydrogenase